MMSAAFMAGIGRLLSRGQLAAVFAAALLFLTPMSFLISIARNSRVLVDRLALGVRARHRPVARGRPCRARPAVDRARRRHARLCVHRLREAGDERPVAGAVALSRAGPRRLPAATRCGACLASCCRAGSTSNRRSSSGCGRSPPRPRRRDRRNRDRVPARRAGERAARVCVSAPRLIGFLGFVLGSRRSVFAGVIVGEAALVHRRAARCAERRSRSARPRASRPARPSISGFSFTLAGGFIATPSCRGMTWTCRWNTTWPPAPFVELLDGDAVGGEDLHRALAIFCAPPRRRGRVRRGRCRAGCAPAAFGSTSVWPGARGMMSRKASALSSS